MYQPFYSFEEVEEKLGPRDSRKIANNTYLQRRDENTIAVRLHSTDVVIFTSQYAELNTGGWFTVTTKERINRYSPAKVYSTKGRWYVYPPDMSWQESEKLKIPYFDGVRISYSGIVLNPQVTPEADEKAIKEAAALKRRIAKYVKLCIKELDEGLPLPSGADCWYCAMQTDNGQTLGDLFHAGDDHLFSHMDEGYVVPSLLYRAVAEAGYPYPQFHLAMTEEGMGGMVTNEWGTRPKALNGSVSRAVRNYLKIRLIHDEGGGRGRYDSRTNHKARNSVHRNGALFKTQHA